MKYILAMDQGTTGTTAALISETAELTCKVNFEYEQIYPQPGWVEHNPEKIWQSVVQAIDAVFEKSGIRRQDVVALGLTNQRETVVVWDRKTGQPVYNAIVWQCRRTTRVCEQLKKRGLQKQIRQKTGLVIDPYFSATKIQWILNNVAGVKQRARRGELACGTIDSFLLWRLTNGRSHHTDVSNASRTQLLNIKTLQWDDELIRLFKVPQNLLPTVLASNAEFGKTHGVRGLPDGLPITGIAGDQQAALFGQACFLPGEAKCTFGTGSFLLLNIGSKPVLSRSGLLTTVGWQLQKQKTVTYALEGGAFICGAAVQFLRDQMQFISKSSEIEALASSVDETAGVEFVPALTGLGAPYWNAKARGLLYGLTRGTNRAHIARATLEAMALQNVEILLSMEKDVSRKIKKLRVDGGAAADNLLMQIQSDFLGTQLDRPKIIETTVAGAAFLAGLGVGLWSSPEQILKTWSIEKTFQPTWTKSQRRDRLHRWQHAVRRALD